MIKPDRVHRSLIRGFITCFELKGFKLLWKLVASTVAQASTQKVCVAPAKAEWAKPMRNSGLYDTPSKRRTVPVPE